jgi:hypothetical protein
MGSCSSAPAGEDVVVRSSVGRKNSGLNKQASDESLVPRKVTAPRLSVMIVDARARTEDIEAAKKMPARKKSSESSWGTLGRLKGGKSKASAYAENPAASKSIDYDDRDGSLSGFFSAVEKSRGLFQPGDDELDEDDLHVLASFFKRQEV